MDKKARLKFSRNGEEVLVIFADEKESIYYTSKEEITAALQVLAEGKRITKNEYRSMTVEVMEAKSLPLTNNENQKSNHEARSGNFSGFFAFALIASLFDDMHDNRPTEKPTEAYFQICVGCGKHAKIIAKEVMTSDFSTKEDGYYLIALLKEGGHINDQEEEKLKSEIETSPLKSKERAKESV